jgi:parallel beta-helix repeat protein
MSDQMMSGQEGHTVPRGAADALVKRWLDSAWYAHVRVTVLAGAVVVGLALGPGQALALECGDVVREDTVLDRDLGPCSGNGLEIDADDVTLDLNGHRLLGPGLAGRGPIGIRIEKQKGVRIKNGVIAGFHVGIYLSETNESRIGDDAEVTPTTLRVEHNRGGIWIRDDSSRNDVVNVQVQDNTDLGGIWVTGSGNEFNRFMRNQVVRNGGAGISFSSNSRGGVSRGLATSNTVSDNGGPGITVSRGTVVVGSNTVERNGGVGVHLWGAERSTVSVNRVRENRSHGIHLQAAEAILALERREALHNMVIDNHVEQNHAHGILLEGASKNRLSGNTVQRNQGVGMHLGAAEDNFLYRNESVENLFGLVLEGQRQEGRSSFTNRSNEVRENVVRNNSNDGIRLSTSRTNHIVGNSVLGHARGTGIALDGANEHALVEQNRLSSNATGIRVLGSRESRLTANRVTESVGTGILVESSARETVLDGNTAHHGGGHGIWVTSPHSRLTRNAANHNGEPGVSSLGINAVVGVTDGGGNTATGNTDPRQCVGVACS